MLFHESLSKPNTSKAPPAFYRLRDVTRVSAFSRSTVYRRISEGRFPTPVQSWVHSVPAPPETCSGFGSRGDSPDAVWRISPARKNERICCKF